MKVEEKSLIFVIFIYFLIEFCSPIPTWIGNYVVWVKVRGGGEGGLEWWWGGVVK